MAMSISGAHLTLQGPLDRLEKALDSLTPSHSDERRLEAIETVSAFVQSVRLLPGGDEELRRRAEAVATCTAEGTPYFIARKAFATSCMDYLYPVRNEAKEWLPTRPGGAAAETLRPARHPVLIGEDDGEKFKSWRIEYPEVLFANLRRQQSAANSLLQGHAAARNFAETKSADMRRDAQNHDPGLDIKSVRLLRKWSSAIKAIVIDLPRRFAIDGNVLDGTMLLADTAAGGLFGVSIIGGFENCWHNDIVAAAKSLRDWEALLPLVTPKSGNRHAGGGGALGDKIKGQTADQRKFDGLALDASNEFRSLFDLGDRQPLRKFCEQYAIDHENLGINSEDLYKRLRQNRERWDPENRYRLRSPKRG